MSEVFYTLDELIDRVGGLGFKMPYLNFFSPASFMIPGIELCTKVACCLQSWKRPIDTISGCVLGVFVFFFFFLISDLAFPVFLRG